MKHMLHVPQQRKKCTSTQAKVQVKLPTMALGFRSVLTVVDNRRRHAVHVPDMATARPLRVASLVV